MNYLFMIIVLVAILLVLGIATFTNFELDNEHYDRLKWIVLRWSYLVTFLALLVKLFNFPYGVETVALVAGIGAMLAGLIGISTSNYKLSGQTTFNTDSFLEMMDESEVDYADTNDLSEE